jgi:hypothetical protein
MNRRRPVPTKIQIFPVALPHYPLPRPREAFPSLQRLTRAAISTLRLCSSPSPYRNTKHLRPLSIAASCHARILSNTTSLTAFPAPSTLPLYSKYPYTYRQKAALQVMGGVPGHQRRRSSKQPRREKSTVTSLLQRAWTHRVPNTPNGLLWRRWECGTQALRLHQRTFRATGLCRDHIALVSEQLVDQSLFLKFGSGSEPSGPLSHHVAQLADREFDMVIEVAVPPKDVMGHETNPVF